MNFQNGVLIGGIVHDTEPKTHSPLFCCAEPSLRSLSFFQEEAGIRDKLVTGVQTCALPISAAAAGAGPRLRPRRGAIAVARRGAAGHRPAGRRPRSALPDPGPLPPPPGSRRRP